MYLKPIFDTGGVVNVVSCAVCHPQISSFDFTCHDLKNVSLCVWYLTFEVGKMWKSVQ